MAWGLTVNGVFLSRLSFNELEDKKEEHEDYMQSLERQLIALAAQSPTTPRDGEDNGPWHQYVAAETHNLLEEIRETSVSLYKVNLALDTLKYNPEDIMDDSEDQGAAYKQRLGVKPAVVCGDRPTFFQAKPKHIPEGWSEVLSGATISGDRLWYPSMGVWSDVGKTDQSLGEDVANLNMVIREATPGRALPPIPEEIEVLP